MPRKIGVAVVGLDHWYTAFPAMAEAGKRRDTHLVAIADKSRRRLSEAAAKHPADQVTTDFDEALADPRVDLVCSLVNTRDNVKVVRQALKAGKHVACVKPMAMTLRQADALIQLAEQQGRVLYSFDLLGRQRAEGELKSLIKRGGIGQPLTVYQTLAGGLPKAWPNSKNPGWWTDPELVPVGAWADHAIYTIDMLRFLFGAEVETVHAEIGNRRYKKLGVEDYGVATLRFTNGVVAVIEDTWASDHGGSWTKIIGTKGMIHMDPAAFSDPVVVVTARGRRTLKPRGFDILRDAVSLVRAGKSKPSPARESRKNLAICFAAYRSAKTGRYTAPS